MEIQQPGTLNSDPDVQVNLGEDEELKRRSHGKEKKDRRGGEGGESKGEETNGDAAEKLQAETPETRQEEIGEL
ncbi:hypothetical protein NDU88_006617 [Pleurodeles waltl]|uniref:Uncharacterized protein n=1 Tax=Pleurodeles waltl TaxID=8319 RepID=A0AAV7ULJ4_PLEWA|nr:hypothetical protein NDU88_006617 [Pleurodeles waltl]